VNESLPKKKHLTQKLVTQFIQPYFPFLLHSQSKWFHIPFLFYKFRCHLLLQQTHLFLPVINAIRFLSSTHNFPNKA